jgi:hypothetical protein
MKNHNLETNKQSKQRGAKKQKWQQWITRITTKKPTRWSWLKGAKINKNYDVNWKEKKIQWKGTHIYPWRRQRPMWKMKFTQMIQNQEHHEKIQCMFYLFLNEN